MKSIHQCGRCEKIKEKYKKLGKDETIFFQAKNKKALISILKQMDYVFDRIDKFEDNFDRLTLKDTWFVLGNWRCGMFELKILSHNGWDDYEIHFCADHKAGEKYIKEQLKKIYDLIKIMDNNMRWLIQKRVMFDNNYNIVKK